MSILQKKGEKLINVFGQIRLYTLLDLILFAYAIGSDKKEILGIVLLHLGFLFYLEYTHKHSYRLPVPRATWIVLGIAGIFLLPHVATIGYIVASIIYVRKNNPRIAPFGPLARGVQYYFLAAAILGFSNPLCFLALVLLFVRNFAGDLRDVVKDTKEGMKTLPIVLGTKDDSRYAHIITLFLTTFIWWLLADISLAWLIAIYIIQLLTYNITTR